MSDHVLLYRSIRQAFSDEVRNAPADALARPVPATPGWTVRDVVAHLAGTTADLNAGNLGGVGSEEWTGAQVESRRDLAIDLVLDEWARESVAVEEGLPLLPNWAGAQLVGDAITHTLDAEAALGSTALRAHPAVSASARYYGKLAADRAREAGRAPLWFVLDDAPVPAGSVAVRATPFELLRAATGRRSPAQIAALDWGGADPSPYLELFSTYPPRATDLSD